MKAIDEVAVAELTLTLVQSGRFDSYEAASAAANRLISEQEIAALTAQAKAEYAEWQTTGQPVSSFYDGTWRERVERASQDTLDGTIPPKTSGEIEHEMRAISNPFGGSGIDMAAVEKQWAADQQRELDARIAEGRVPHGSVR